MKIVICGGHLSPALSVIENLPKGDKVIVFGRKHAHEGDDSLTLEYKTMQNRNIPFIPITTGRLQRKLTRHTVPSLVKTPYGFFQSLVALRALRPDVVLSFGGYVAAPVVLAAHVLKIPIVLHEQTLEAGASNRLLARFAKKVCISWESSAAFFPKNKTVLTGNPIRKYQISNIQFPIPEGKKPLLYVTGGSTGAHAINELIEGCLEKLIKKYRIIHQTGDAKQYADFDRLSEKKESLGKEKDDYVLTKFVQPEDVAGILKEADLVVSRSGANTVTELLYYKKPCLLIPLPISQNNEQKKNALMVKDAGLAEVLDQYSVTPDMLCQKIITMTENLSSYKTQSSIADVVEQAANSIISVLHSVAS